MPTALRALFSSCLDVEESVGVATHIHFRPGTVVVSIKGQYHSSTFVGAYQASDNLKIYYVEVLIPENALLNIPDPTGVEVGYRRSLELQCFDTSQIESKCPAGCVPLLIMNTYLLSDFIVGHLDTVAESPKI